MFGGEEMGRDSVFSLMLETRTGLSSTGLAFAPDPGLRPASSLSSVNDLASDYLISPCLFLHLCKGYKDTASQSHHDGVTEPTAEHETDTIYDPLLSFLAPFPSSFYSENAHKI